MIFNKFTDFSEQLSRGVHAFGTHVFKVMLTNVAPVSTNTARANLTEIAAGNGYTTGGNTVTITISETAGITTIGGDKTTFTASGGAMASFRYAVLYNDTATSPADALVGWWDYGAAVTLADSESFAVKFNNVDTNGTILTVTV